MLCVKNCHLWQQGPLLPGNVLGIHSVSGPNVKSYGSLDFINGKVGTTNAVDSKKAAIKNVHGIINGISWVILMPVGAMIDGYLKRFRNGKSSLVLSSCNLSMLCLCYWRCWLGNWTVAGRVYWDSM